MHQANIIVNRQAQQLSQYLQGIRFSHYEHELRQFGVDAIGDMLEVKYKDLIEHLNMKKMEADRLVRCISEIGVSVSFTGEQMVRFVGSYLKHSHVYWYLCLHQSLCVVVCGGCVHVLPVVAVCI